MVDFDFFLKYEIKRWPRMAFLKKVDLYELAKYHGYKFYYSSFGEESVLNQVHVRNCLHCDRKLDLEFSKNRFWFKNCDCTKNGNTDLTLYKLTCKIEPERARVIIEQHNLKKTAKCKNKLSYWIDLGFDEENAKQQVLEYNTKNGQIAGNMKRGRKDVSHRSAAFWIRKHGYTVEEANAKVKEIQTTNGLNQYIAKYGEIEGTIKFNDRIERWIKSAKLRREDQIEYYGLETYIEMRDSKFEKLIQTKIDQGIMIPKELQPERELYYKKVRTETSFSITRFHHLINPDNLEISFRNHHVDHMYSISQGFLNNIDYRIIGSPANLQVIPWVENISKNYKCSITKDELFERYQMFLEQMSI